MAAEAAVSSRMPNATVMTVMATTTRSLRRDCARLARAAALCWRPELLSVAAIESNSGCSRPSLTASTWLMSLCWM